MFKNKNLLALSLKFLIPVGLLISPDALFAQRYRVILPPAPPPPPSPEPEFPCPNVPAPPTEKPPIGHRLSRKERSSA